MNFLTNLKTKTAALAPTKKQTAVAAALLFGATGAAMASSSGSTDFQTVQDRIDEWLTGSLGKTFALGALAVGLGIGIVKQTVMSVVTGVGIALACAIGPGVLMAIFGATL